MRVSAQSIPLLSSMSEMMYLQILPFAHYQMISKMMQHETVAHIEEVNPTITKIHYFLDSCAAQ